MTVSARVNSSNLQVHVLKNIYGWVVSYHEFTSGPDWNEIKIVTRHKGCDVSEIKMNREEAREHYRMLLRQGFENINKNF